MREPNNRHIPSPLASHDSGGEEAKILQRKAGAACSLFCFHIRRRRQPNSPSVGLRRTLADDWWKWKPPAPPPTGRSSLLAHVLRPESTHTQIPHTQKYTKSKDPPPCPRRQTREHTCPLPKYHLPQYPESKIKKKRIENGALFPKI